MRPKHKSPEEQLSEERRRTLLCSGLSCEIEQAASTIMLAAEHLQKQVERLAPPEQSWAMNSTFEVIDDSVLCLARISENLSDLLDSQSDLLQAELQPVDLVWQYGRILERCKASGKLHHMQLHWHCEAPTGQYVQADPVWADKVLLNLISNALRCGQPGSVVEVRLEQLPGREGLVLTVKDDGPGLPEQVKRYLFEPFVTNRLPGSGRKGAGLGLYLVRQYCATLNWQFSLDTKDTGTTIQVIAPFGVSGKGNQLQSAARDLAFCSEQDRRISAELSALNL